MRAKIIGGLVASALLVPGVAMAQEADPCYVDPTSEECLGADDGEVDGVDDGEVGQVDDDGVAQTDDGVDGTEVCVDSETGALVDLETGEVISGEAAEGTPPCDDVAQAVGRLADTGIDVRYAAVGSAFLLLLGAVLLAARRRASSAA